MQELELRQGYVLFRFKEDGRLEISLGDGYEDGWIELSHEELAELQAFLNQQIRGDS